MKFILIVLVGLCNLRKTTSCVAQYGQCGGIDYRGSTECCVPSICEHNNLWFSQCIPSSAPSTAGCSGVYGQCGGENWSGPTCCDYSICTYSDSYYSQCLRNSSSSSNSESTTSTSTQRSSTSSTMQSSENENRRLGVTTRYGDCCKASCGWLGKAAVTNPVQTCESDGITPVDVNTQSGCNGGTAYMCNNQQPWSINSTLSYGYAAAHISNQDESDWCCACYSLIFTSGPVIGKELIVQVTNTGGDLGNDHFDLQMPGGGVGVLDGCSSQFPGSYSWGQRYDGVSQRSDCDNLPAVIQSGCYWRFDWFMNANNPTISFKKVDCPSALIDNTQCQRI